MVLHQKAFLLFTVSAISKWPTENMMDIVQFLCDTEVYIQDKAPQSLVNYAISTKNMSNEITF